jgi:hypothetical protein
MVRAKDVTGIMGEWTSFTAIIPRNKKIYGVLRLNILKRLPILGKLLFFIY